MAQLKRMIARVGRVPYDHMTKNYKKYNHGSTEEDDSPGGQGVIWPQGSCIKPQHSLWDSSWAWSQIQKQPAQFFHIFFYHYQRRWFHLIAKAFLKVKLGKLVKTSWPSGIREKANFFFHYQQHWFHLMAKAFLKVKLGKPSNTTLRILSVSGVPPPPSTDFFLAKKELRICGVPPSPHLQIFPWKFFFKKG